VGVPVNDSNRNRIGPINTRWLFPSGFRARPADFLLTFGSVALTTVVLLLVRSRLSPQVIALLYLLPVMLSATRWGPLPALAASVVSFFAFNFFFLVPTYTFAVSDPEELLALMVFLLVAVLLSQAVATANRHAARAEFREREATTLYALTRALETPSDWQETLASISAIITDSFGLAGCEILTIPEKEPLSSGEGFSGFSPDGDSKINGMKDRSPEGAADIRVGGIAGTALRHVDIPLAARQAPVGTLRLFLGPTDTPPGPTTMRLLTTFAAQVGLFIERARLAREAGRAQLLEESDRLKSALLSSVSHDLRTPLSAIKASATVLLKEDQALDPSTRQDLLSAINEETDRLNRLFGDLLDQSRIEAGALRLKHDWCDMDELIRAVARRHGVRVQFHWPPDLPLRPGRLRPDRPGGEQSAGERDSVRPVAVEHRHRSPDRQSGDDGGGDQSGAGHSPAAASASIRQVLPHLRGPFSEHGNRIGLVDLQRDRGGALLRRGRFYADHGDGPGDPAAHPPTLHRPRPHLGRARSGFRGPAFGHRFCRPDRRQMGGWRLDPAGQFCHPIRRGPFAAALPARQPYPEANPSDRAGESACSGSNGFDRGVAIPANAGVPVLDIDRGVKNVRAHRNPPPGAV
jgi:two-component system sensor histidine kinase KdpD